MTMYKGETAQMAIERLEAENAKIRDFGTSAGADLLDARNKMKALELQNSELKSEVERWKKASNSNWDQVVAQIEKMEVANRLNERMRIALETIASTKDCPRYPDGDAMSEEMCAKIALGLNCGTCGSTLPCREHKEQQTEKRVAPVPNAPKAKVIHRHCANTEAGCYGDKDCCCPCTPCYECNHF